MKDLKTILTESFFANVGAVYSIADIITKGKGSIKLCGRDVTEVPIRNKSVTITRTGPESIHVVTKDRYYSKKEFDAPFPVHQTLFLSTIVYFTATLIALSPNFAITIVSDTAQDAVPSTAEDEPISLPSAA